MKLHRYLLAATVSFFLGFLVGPSFPDTIDANETITWAPGVAWILVLLFNILPFCLASPSFALLPVAGVLLASFGFIGLLLRFAVWKSRLRRDQYLFGVIFLGGVASMIWMLFLPGPVSIGVYLWLLAAASALVFCGIPFKATDVRKIKAEPSAGADGR